jgi:hypothetical protein
VTVRYFTTWLSCSFELVVTEKFHVGFVAQHDPVAHLFGGVFAGARFLFLQGFYKTVMVHRPAFFAGDQVGEVDGESEGVVEFESLLAADGVVLISIPSNVSDRDSRVRRKDFSSSKITFTTKSICAFSSGKYVVEFLGENGRHAVHHGFFQVEERVVIAHCAAQNAANDVAGARIGGQFAVGDGEAHGAQVVGHHAHGHVGFFPVFMDFRVSILRR